MKFSQYNATVDGKDGLLLINILNSNYVKINKEEDIKHFIKLYKGEIELSENDNMVKPLYQRGYIVDDNVDEYAIAKSELQERLDIQSKHLKIFLYVTDQCNFRCVYCPQDHVDKYFSSAHYDCLYKFIKEKVTKNEINSLTISFFGGEPLLCVDKIIQFLEKIETLKSVNPELRFNHHITTNAYLLTSEVYDRLTALGILQYQITVDGFAETHNKTRVLAGGQGSWDKIIGNLEYINSKNDGAYVAIRTNYNNNNIDSLIEFKKWEEEHFTNPKFEFIYEPVSNLSDKVPEEMLADKYSEKSMNLDEDVNNGMNIFKKYECICNSAYPNNYAISTDGKIAKCENLSNYNEDAFIGYLTEEGEVIFKDNRKQWEEDFEIDACKECLIYPICCARTCPAKKALCPEERPDCYTMQESFKKRMLHFAENKM